MNNADIATRIADEANLTKASAKAIVDRVFSLIAGAAERGEEVSIGGFGKFKVKTRQARSGRNPRTGDPMDIPASRKLAFAPAKGLKDKLSD